MQDLRETTHSRHYENFRCEKLREMIGGLKVRGMVRFKYLSFTVVLTGSRE